MEYFITHVDIDLMVNPTVTFEVLEDNPSRIGAKKIFAGSVTMANLDSIKDYKIGDIEKACLKLWHDRQIQRQSRTK